MAVNEGEQLKKPRLVHYCDGVAEEFSSDEDEDQVVKEAERHDVVDPRSLSWYPWMFWMLASTSTRFVEACDSAGEKLAWWFGITSPKYYYEIQEALRMKEEEEKRKQRQDAEMAGWSRNESPATVSRDVKPARLEEE